MTRFRPPTRRFCRFVPFWMRPCGIRSNFCVQIQALGIRVFSCTFTASQTRVVCLGPSLEMLWLIVLWKSGIGGGALFFTGLWFRSGMFC